MTKVIFQIENSLPEEDIALLQNFRSWDCDYPRVFLFATENSNTIVCSGPKAQIEEHLKL